MGKEAESMWERQHLEAAKYQHASELHDRKLKHHIVEAHVFKSNENGYNRQRKKVIQSQWNSSRGSTMSIEKIPTQTHTASLSVSLNNWVTSQTNDTCDNTCLPLNHPAPLFSFCPCVFLFSLCVCLDQEAAFLIWTHKLQWTAGAACGSSTLGKLCLNFEAGRVSACPRGCPEHSAAVGLSKGEVNGTGKQEVPARWLTACLDTKRWILEERWLTDKWPLTDRI